MNPVITNLDEVRRVAEEKHDTFAAMRAALEGDETISDESLDEMIEAIAEPIIAAIDCKQCANCCRTMDVCLVPPDIDRLSTALNISIDDVVTIYADEDLGAVQGEWAVIPVKPCPLLRGNLCSIYAHRPHACRVYPQFTPDFRYNMEDTLDSAPYCPIVYNTLSALAERLNPLPPIEE